MATWQLHGLNIAIGGIRITIGWCPRKTRIGQRGDLCSGLVSGDGAVAVCLQVVQRRTGFGGCAGEALDAVIGEVQVVSVGGFHARHAAIVVVIGVRLREGLAADLVALPGHPVVSVVLVLCPEDGLSA